jgi:Ulp1 family protease
MNGTDCGVFPCAFAESGTQINNNIKSLFFNDEFNTDRSVSSEN